jgi:uncharacterized membrane protein
MIRESADSPKRRILSQDALMTTEHSRHAKAHIDSIVRQEEEALEKRSYSERLADRVGTFAGSFVFVAFHLLLVTAWLTVNTGHISGIRPFDPSPSSLLGFVVAVEVVILSSFILYASESDTAPRRASGLSKSAN